MPPAHAPLHSCTKATAPSPASLPLPAERPSPLAAPLTAREREVLHLLLEGASNRDIASRLVLRVDTVQRPGYTRCGKLGVKRRPQAIARARALDLA